MFDSSGVINILSNEEKSIGTGFFVSPEGYILTCAHILSKAEYKIKDSVFCRFANISDSFTAVWQEISTLNSDIAVLKTTPVKPVVFYNLSSSIGYTGVVESFGFPNGTKNGIFAKAEVYDTIQCPSGNTLTQLGKANDITYGFSGAPIVTEVGSVIGMVSSIPKPDDTKRLVNIAFAIPASVIIGSFGVFSSNIKPPAIENGNIVNSVHFVGREIEILQYSELMNRNNVTIIHGMPGVGKTTLAFYLFDTVISTPKLWITIRKDINNEAETVIHDISEYLARHGIEKPINMFFDLKNNSQSYEVAFSNLQGEIIKSILSLNLAIFIDDAHLINSNEETRQFFTSLIMKCKNNKFVFITRHVLDFVAPEVNGNPLGGLIKKDCNELLIKAGLTLSDSQLDSLYNKTQGNAKFLEVCIFSLLEQDCKTIEDIINDISADFNLNNYIRTNITDRFTLLETKILNAIALCRKPVKFDLISKICTEYGFENIYFALDRFVRRNIIDKSNDDYYNMHALLKDHFSRLSSTDMLLMHVQIAKNFDSEDHLEVSYHYASCGRIGKALSILIINFDELISKGYTTSLFKQILSYRSLIQKEDEIQYFLSLGKLHIARGQYDEAISTLKQVLPTLGTLYVFECFILLSQCYEKKGDYSNAFNALADAEKCINVRDHTQMALININRGFLLCHQEKISKGIMLCEQGLKVLDIQTEISKNLLAEGYNNLGWNYTIKGNYSKALNVLEKSVSLYSNDSRGLALAKIRLARINWQMGRLKEALNYINLAEELANLTGDPQLQAFSIRQKNLILWNFGEFDRSLLGHKNSLKKYSRIKDYWGIAASLENLAAVLYDIGQYEKAMKYIDNAIKICKQIAATDFLAYAYLYKSRILAKQGFASMSVDYAKKSINLLRRWKYLSYYYGMALISLGIAYMSNKSFTKSKIIFYLASKKLSKGSALFQKHIAEFYKALSQGKQPLIDKCYEYFVSIGAKRLVAHLKSLEINFKDSKI